MINRRKFLSTSILGIAGLGSTSLLAKAGLNVGFANQTKNSKGKSETNHFNFQRDIPIIDNYELVVAGGGPGGVAAAIAAARLGVKVLLVEALGCLGGIGTSGMVCYWMELSDGNNLLAQGIFLEILEKLHKNNGLSRKDQPSTWNSMYHVSTTFNPETLKIVLDDLCVESGVDILFNTKVIDADIDKENKRVNGVVIQHTQGYSYVVSKCFVDATGNASIANYCGVKLREAGKDTEHIMPPTLCGMVTDIDWSKTSQMQEKVLKGIKDGFFSQNDRHVPGIIQCGDNWGFMNAGHIFGTNSLDVKSISEGFIKGRKLVREYTQFYQKYVEGAKNMKTLSTATLLGVRESRNILGEYELNYEDFKNRRQFPDQIGLHCFPVDIHVYDLSDKEYKRYLEDYAKRDRFLIGENYGLPYGILVPKGWNNLWIAGSCISADVKVHGSVRLQQSCYIMGQAAGTAVSQSIKTGQTANNIDTEQLVKTLRSNGAFLPQEKLSKTMTRS